MEDKGRERAVEREQLMDYDKKQSSIAVQELVGLTSKGNYSMRKNMS